MVFGNCDFNATGYVFAPVGVGARLYGCHFASVMSFWGGTWGIDYQAGGPVFFYGAEVAGIGSVGVSYFEGGVTFAQHSRSLGPGRFGVFDATVDGIYVAGGSSILLDSNWDNGALGIGTGYGLNCQGYVRYIGQPTLVGTADEVLIGANALDWTDVPHKNTLPNQAQWVGAAAIQGADTNDYHVIAT